MSYNGQVSLEKERCTELGEQLNKQLSREIALEADDTFKKYPVQLPHKRYIIKDT
jgi:hypothetical protein